MGNKSSTSVKIGGRKFVPTDVGRNQWTIEKRYETESDARAGTFGSVVIARDKKRDLPVAIKKIDIDFTNDRHPHVVYREVRAMKAINHPHVLNLLDIFCPVTSPEQVESVYLVMPLVGMDLQDYFGNLRGPDFSQHTIRNFTAQLAHGLQYLHSGGLVHRDLKPSNICVRNGIQIVIIDLGFIRLTGEEDMTRGTGTPSFMAPEVLFRQDYTTKADMFSFGLLVAMMHLREYLIRGHSYEEAFENLFQTLGTPPVCIMETIDDPRVMNYLPTHRYVGQDLGTLIREATDDGLEFMRNLLDYDPDRRMSANDSLRHPYIENYRNERVDSMRLDPYSRADEHREDDFDTQGWRQQILNESRNYPLNYDRELV